MASVKRAKTKRAAVAAEGPSKTKEGYLILKGGTVLTPELEEKWTKEFEEGLDPSTFRAIRVGRPPLDGERVSERITFRIPPDLYDAAKAKADKELRSISNLAREALKRYVES
jgi:predicted HicB family RNase H-like nuclease